MTTVAFAGTGAVSEAEASKDGESSGIIGESVAEASPRQIAPGAGISRRAGSASALTANSVYRYTEG